MRRFPQWASVPLLLLLLTLARPGAIAFAAGSPPDDKDLARSGLSPESRLGRLAVGYYYTVQPGDTLWDIAAAHRLALDELTGCNPPGVVKDLQPGQKIFVPASPVAMPRKTPVPKPTPTSPPPPAPMPAAAPAQPNPPAAEPAQPAGKPAPAQPTPVPKQPAAAPVSPELANWAASLLQLVNVQRAASGLIELTWSPELAGAAQAHAEDCAHRSWGSHVGSDGAPLHARLVRAGYAARASSENWANTQGASQTFNLWWNEPPAWGPHRHNILDPRWKELGVGIARGSWGWYFVADFGAR